MRWVNGKIAGRSIVNSYLDEKGKLTNACKAGNVIKGKTYFQVRAITNVRGSNKRSSSVWSAAFKG